MRTHQRLQSIQIILFALVCIFALHCSNSKTADVSDGSNLGAKHETTADICSFCTLEPFLINTSNVSLETRITIDFPVAIVLFDHVELIHKYERENYDTLMKVFKMKHWGDRNKIYQHYELYGYYMEGIKPVLVNNAVTIIDTIKHEQYVRIIDGDKKYIIDLLEYRKVDGVLMFKPGKPPVYWNMDKDEQGCYSYYGFPKWYFNCP